MGNPCFVYSVYIVLMVLLALNAAPKAVAEEKKAWVEINKTSLGRSAEEKDIKK